MLCRMLFRLFSAFVSASVFSCFPAEAALQEFYPARSFSGSYLAGHIANKHNNINAAISYFHQALSYQPDNIIIKRHLMLTSLAAGQFRQASQLAHALHGDPDTGSVARLVLAANSFRKKRYTQARDNIRHNKNDVIEQLVSALLSAWATYGNGDRQKAVLQLDQISGPIWYDIFRHYHMALMYDMNGQKKEANREFRKAVEDQESSAAIPDTYERIVMAYASFMRGNKKQQDAITLLKDTEVMLSGRNALHNMRQQIEERKKTGKLISTPAEGAAEAVYNIGTAINRAGSEPLAHIYLQIALAIRPGNDATIFQLADFAAKSGKPREAASFYQNIDKNSPYFRDADLRLGISLADAGENEKAIRHLDHLVSLSPDDTMLASTLASLYMQNSDYAQAARILDHAVALSDTGQRNNWSLFYQCGVAYERLEEWDKAESVFRKALALDPEQPQVLNYLGYSLVDRNMKLEEALEMVRKAANLHPQDGYIVDSLGWAYYKLGRYHEAVEVLERAVSLRPEDTTINDHLGDAYWKVGRRLEATFQWNHAIAGITGKDEPSLIQEKLKHGIKQTEPVLSGQT